VSVSLTSNTTTPSTPIYYVIGNSSIGSVSTPPTPPTPPTPTSSVLSIYAVSIPRPTSFVSVQANFLFGQSTSLNAANFTFSALLYRKSISSTISNATAWPSAPSTNTLLVTNTNLTSAQEVVTTFLFTPLTLKKDDSIVVVISCSVGAGQSITTYTFPMSVWGNYIFV